jgi:hypothetical protein
VGEGVSVSQGSVGELPVVGPPGELDCEGVGIGVLLFSPGVVGSGVAVGGG